MRTRVVVAVVGVAALTGAVVYALATGDAGTIRTGTGSMKRETMAGFVGLILLGLVAFGLDDWDY